VRLLNLEGNAPMSININDAPEGYTAAPWKARSVWLRCDDCAFDGRVCPVTGARLRCSALARYDGQTVIFIRKEEHVG